MWPSAHIPFLLLAWTRVAHHLWKLGQCCRFWNTDVNNNFWHLILKKNLACVFLLDSSLLLFFQNCWDLNSVVCSFLDVLQYCNSMKQRNPSKMAKVGMALLFHLLINIIGNWRMRVWVSAAQWESQNTNRNNQLLLH